MATDGVSKLLAVLDRQAFNPPPVWMMRQAGRYLPEYRAIREKAGSFWAMCMNPELAAEVTLQPIQRFGMDGAILFSDILVIPWALGAEVRFEEGIGPIVTRFNEIAEIERDPAIWTKKLNPVYDTLRLLRTKLAPQTALLGFAGAPWTLATYLAEGGSSDDQRCAKLWGYQHRESFTALLDLLAQAVATHLIAQLKAGAQAVQIFDSWASSLNPRAFTDWVIQPTRKIVEIVRREIPGAKIIGFPRATTLDGYRRYAEETEVDAVSLDTAVPMDWAVETLAPYVVLQGNLDPIALLAGGTALDQAIDDIVSATNGVPFIFNLGHGVVPQTPPAHVAAAIARLRGQR